MMTRRPLTFDADALRAFVTGMELGSFALAAERLGRSTSAISAQLKSLSSRAARRWYKGRASSGVDGGRGDYAELRAANA
jgi:hypothetical protein